MKSAPITLTIRARNAAHAKSILDAVEQLEVAAEVAELLVTPDGTGAPTGHTYRELCDARRAGLIDASITGKGLVFTRDALETYRRVKADRRRARPKASPAPVTDLTEHRIKALEAGGFSVGKKRR